MYANELRKVELSMGRLTVILGLELHPYLTLFWVGF